jgi:asparagine synthase (glutamine-hydrolysing)
MVSANLLGLKLHTIEMDPNSLLHAMDESSYRAEGLAVNLHAGAKILLAHATRESGYKVTFTGEGADEAFYGYEFFRSDFNESERPKTTDLNLATLGLQRPDGDAYGDLASLQDLCGAIPAWLKAKAVSGHTLSRCFGQRLNETPINRARLVADLPEATRSALQNASSPERARSLWTIYGLSGYILRGLDDPNGMSRGVESRFVFLDPAVQWLAARIAPLTHYGIDGIEKGLMREALGDVLPKEVSTRPKRPFLVPSIFELEVGRRWARERLLGGRLVSSGLFSEFALNNILSQAASPGRDARICTLASLSSFMNVFNLQ